MWSLMCLGEAAAMSGEAASRANPDLPGRQRELAEAVLDIGKPVVALLSSGRPLIAPWLVERANAVVATWFLGGEAGQRDRRRRDRPVQPDRPPARHLAARYRAGADLLRRAAIGPTRQSERSLHQQISRHAGRPQFPFGHGLSYSPFRVGRTCAPAPERSSPATTFQCPWMSSTKGPCDGEATVFLFIRDVVASVARPLLELKGLAKIALAPGGRGTVHLSVAGSAFAFPNADFQPAIEPGRFELSVGLSADRATLLTLEMDAVAG